MKTTKELKGDIDNMSQEELCFMWRFEPSGSPYFQDEIGTYFKEAMVRAGGFTPEISKSINERNA